MAVGLTAVFPRAAAVGGVERVVAEFLRFEVTRRPTTFVGIGTDVADVQFVQARPARVPVALEPWAFRRAASAALADLAAETTVSFGVQCPPGDVYWVGSVHRAWVEGGGEIRFRGLRVPSQIRQLMPRHRVLLQLEHDYFMNHRPRAVLCTSQREVDDLAHYYRVPREIMHVVPNGYDPLAFNPARSGDERAAMRERLGATSDEIVVLMVANEWHRKGLGTALEAVAAVGDSRLRVDLVGARSPQDYQPLARRLGLADRLHWHGSTSDVGAFMAAADIFVLPTIYEPFGMVIIEAMASGLPVVTSRLAGASTAIDHGMTGLLLEDPTNVEELGRALECLLVEADRRAMGAAAALSVSDYQWSSIFERAEALIWA